jgi:hypothetical protein
MKRVLFLVCSLWSLSACNKNDELGHQVYGKWMLSQTFIETDMPDGKWLPADTSHPTYVIFYGNGSLTMTPDNIYSANHYKITGDSSMVFIQQWGNVSAKYIVTDTLLTIFPFCMEPCGQKYVPVR